jgi:hypothetical protein
MDLLSQQIGVYLQDYGGHEALKTISIRDLPSNPHSGFPIRQLLSGLVNIAPYYLAGGSQVDFQGGGDLYYF